MNIAPPPVAPSPAVNVMQHFAADLAAFAGGADRVSIKPTSATDLEVTFHSWGANQAAGVFLNSAIDGARLVFRTDDPHGMGIPPDSQMAVNYLQRFPGVNGAVTSDGVDVHVFANDNTVADHLRQLVKPSFPTANGTAAINVFAQPLAEPA